MAISNNTTNIGINVLLIGKCGQGKSSFINVLLETKLNGKSHEINNANIEVLDRFYEDIDSCKNKESSIFTDYEDFVDVKNGFVYSNYDNCQAFSDSYKEGKSGGDEEFSGCFSEYFKSCINC